MINKQTVQRINSARIILAIALIGLPLCVMIYHEVKTVVPLQIHNALTFRSYSHDLRFGYRDTIIGRMDLDKAWQPRILGRMLGSLFTKPADKFRGNEKRAEFIHLVGVYVAFWLGLTFLLYLGFLGKDALIPILGTYAAVAFVYTPAINDRVYPWDMPMLFFFSLFVCLLIKEKLPYFILIIPIATLFRESVAVLVPAYLFLSGSIRKRLFLFGAAASLYLATKATAGILTNVGGGFSFNPTLLITNVRYILFGTFPNIKEFYPNLYWLHHPFFLDAGLLAAFILYPFRGNNALILRIITLVFIAVMFVFGVVIEYRGWLELTPILLYPLYASKLGPSATTGEPLLETS